MKEFFNKYINTKPELSRSQFIGMIGIIVVISGIFGWVYEFSFYFLNSGMKEFFWRGGNFLPWINIYATGALMILILSFRFRKNPLIVFAIAFISTGVLEYFSGMVIFEVFHARFWNYNTEILNFGNINGYVCLRSVLFFGVSSWALMYLIVPFSYWLATHLSIKKFLIISVTLFTIVMFDELYNLAFARLLNTPRALDVYESIGFNFVDSEDNLVE